MLRHLNPCMYVWTMPEASNQIQVNREEVRMLALEIGVREAARRLGLNEDRVCKWSERGNWFSTPKHINSSQALVSTVSRPSVVLTDEITRLEGETRTSLARSAAHLAKQGESAELNASGHVRNAAQVAQIAFKWRDDEKPSHFTLNQLNINTLAIDQPSTLD